jgi:hypothetical protein
MKYVACVSVFVALAIGCGPSNSFHGTINGQSFTPRAAIFFPVSKQDVVLGANDDDAGSNPAPVAQIEMLMAADTSNYCDNFRQGLITGNQELQDGGASPPRSPVFHLPLWSSISRAQTEE